VLHKRDIDAEASLTATEMQPPLLHLCNFGSAQQRQTAIHPEILVRMQGSWTSGSERFLFPARPEFNIQGTVKSKNK